LKHYRAYVLSTPERVFPSEHFASQLPSPASVEKITQLFAEAQLNYTEGSMSEARASFQKIIALEDTDQWSADELSAILYSYLRLAQMESDQIVVEDWLHRAAAVSGSVDESYFPPPIIKRWKELKNSLKTAEISSRDLFPDYRYMLANGTRFDLSQSQKIQLPSATMRFTLISDTFETVSFKADSSELKRSIPDRKPWVTGSCKHDQIKWSSQVPAEAFHSLECSSPKPDIAFTAPAVSEPEPMSVRELSPIPKKKSILENKWFWIGLGAVAITVASLSQQPKDEPKKVQTNSEGF
jgi:hypothetical protein